MKVAIPLLTENLLANDLAQARFIMLYKHHDKPNQIIPMEEVKETLQTISFTEFLKVNQLEAVIGSEFNFLTLRIMKENNILPLKAVSQNLAPNLEAIRNNCLEPFQSIDSGYHKPCTANCDSCTSTCNQ